MRITNNQPPLIPIGLHLIVVGIANFILIAPILDNIFHFPAEVFDLYLNLMMAMAIVGCILAVVFPKINISFPNRNNMEEKRGDFEEQDNFISPSVRRLFVAMMVLSALCIIATIWLIIRNGVWWHW